MIALIVWFVAAFVAEGFYLWLAMNDAPWWQCEFPALFIIVAFLRLLYWPDGFRKPRRRADSPLVEIMRHCRRR